MKTQFRILIALILLGVAASCSTASVPVMQFETGESLGSGHYRAALTVEESRMFPFPNLGAVAAQSAGIFQGGVSSIRGEYGLLNGFDLGVAAVITTAGGGWKLQGKYQFLNSGLLAASFLVGYGITSGSGSIDYLGATAEDDQNLSLKTLYFALPLSYRISPITVFYVGLLANEVSVNGIDNGNAISTSDLDWGADLGLRLRINFIEMGFEVAFINVSDPFSGSSRFVPYSGLSLGVGF